MSNILSFDIFLIALKLDADIAQYIACVCVRNVRSTYKVYLIN